MSPESTRSTVPQHWTVRERPKNIRSTEQVRVVYVLNVSNIPIYDANKPSSEFSKPDRSVVERESSIHVLHKAISQEPNTVAKTRVHSSQSTYTLARATLRLPPVDILRRDRPVFTTPVKGDLRWGAAWEGEEAVLLVEELATSGVVDGLHIGSGAQDETKPELSQTL